jgi:hypothetical protein
MRAMIFGAKCSPFMAQFVKNHNARGFEDECANAVEAVIKQHYVDDYLDSQESVEESLTLIKDVLKIHEHGGFVF